MGLSVCSGEMGAAEKTRDPCVCSSKSSWRLRLGGHWHRSGISGPREFSRKPPPGLGEVLLHMLSSGLTPEPLPAGLGCHRKHSLNDFHLQNALFICPGLIHEATLGLQSIPAAQAGTQGEHPWAGTPSAGVGKVPTGKLGETKTLL